MKKALVSVVLLALLVGGAFLLLSRPVLLAEAALPDHQADSARGKLLYTIGGCLSCHKPPTEAAGFDAELPSGGRPLVTPVGTFYPPNLTPDEETGIGGWRDIDFVNAVSRGISPGGQHYFPALPYVSYSRMPIGDILDIKAYLATMPAVKSSARTANLPAERLLRRGVGLWKHLAFTDAPLGKNPAMSASWNRGEYLVNGPGHCGECHTPRTIFMTSDNDRYMAGGPHPEGGKDKVPSLRDLVGRGRYADAAELVSAMRFGEMLGFDKMSSGGMGQVQSNLAKLPEEDVKAIAEYLVSLK